MQGKGLSDIAGTAGATVGLVIATSIFLQMLTTKFISIFERYRGLTGELRGLKDDDGQRRQSLREQITLYQRRSHYIRIASCILTYTEFAFLGTIILASLSVLWPDQVFLQVLGGITMAGGLIGIGVAAGLEISENRLSRAAIESELKDFSDLPLDEYDPD